MLGHIDAQSGLKCEVVGLWRNRTPWPTIAIGNGASRLTKRRRPGGQRPVQLWGQESRVLRAGCSLRQPGRCPYLGMPRGCWTSRSSGSRIKWTKSGACGASCLPEHCGDGSEVGLVDTDVVVGVGDGIADRIDSASRQVGITKSDLVRQAVDDWLAGHAPTSS